MTKRETLRWSVRGFALGSLALLVVALVVSPVVSLAQDRVSNLNAGRQKTEAGPSETMTTDDPLGRVLIPLADDAPPGTNLEPGVDNGASVALSATDAVVSEEGLHAYSSPLVISAADFCSDGFFPDTNRFWFGGGYHEGTSAHYGCMMAPAYLPDGATVTHLYTSVYDNDPNYGILVTLWRVNNFDGSVDPMAEASTTEAGAIDDIQVLSDPTIDQPLVVYPDYTYYVTTCVTSADIRLYSARFYYY